MEHLLGLLRVRVIRGHNLAVRDMCSSDPYVVLKMGGVKVKTHVIKKNLNPEWNEDLTLSVSEPITPVKLEVYDKDTFSPDDSMGDAELEIGPIVEAAKMNLAGVGDGTVLNILIPSRKNCLAEESRVVWLDGKVTQNACLRLKNVESGEIELQLEWVYLPDKKPF